MNELVVTVNKQSLGVQVKSYNYGTIRVGNPSVSHDVLSTFHSTITEYLRLADT